MLELIRPTTELHAAWLRCHAEWGPGEHEDGFGLDAGLEVISAAGFADWVALLHAEEDASVWDGPVVRACSHRWIVEGGEVMGGIATRAGASEFVQRNGHVGYGVRPSARGRGIATWALGVLARELLDVRGMSRVLVVCEAGNRASATTIERAGGRIDAAASSDRVSRYWIEQGRG